MVRRDNRTVISMANDYKGALTEFALVVPVPTVLERSQIRIGDRKLFERIDATARRGSPNTSTPILAALPKTDALNAQMPRTAAAPMAARKSAATRRSA